MRANLIYDSFYNEFEAFLHLGLDLELDLDLDLHLELDLDPNRDLELDLDLDLDLEQKGFKFIVKTVIYEICSHLA